MSNLIDESLDALRSKFSGAGTPTSTVQFEWWADTSAGILKLRNEADADWISVYDFSNSAILINDDQITALKIAGAARKPTLIEGEDIGPATCSIKTKPSSGALPMYCDELFSLVSSLGDLSLAGWQTVLDTKIYVPSDVEMLYALAKQETCNMRFIVGAVNSTEAGIVDPGPSWGSEASLDVSALSGWQTFAIQAFSTQGSAPWGGIKGLSARWGD
jgi:hypothetical protein